MQDSLKSAGKKLIKFSLPGMAYFFIFAGAALRLVPHPANFAPIAALGLFGGTYLNKKYALFVPLLAMLLSDIYLGFASFWVTFSVYLSFFLIGALGLWLKNHKTIPNTIGASLTGSILFFIVTNFAVWATTPWYAKTWEGFVQCYLLAVPFFRNTILGDLFYVAVIFGLYELVQFAVRKKLFQRLVRSRNL